MKAKVSGVSWVPFLCNNKGNVGLGFSENSHNLAEFTLVLNTAFKDHFSEDSRHILVMKNSRKTALDLITV